MQFLLIFCPRPPQRSRSSVNLAPLVRRVCSAGFRRLVPGRTWPKPCAPGEHERVDLTDIRSSCNHVFDMDDRRNCLYRLYLGECRNWQHKGGCLVVATASYSITREQKDFKNRTSAAEVGVVQMKGVVKQGTNIGANGVLQVTR